MTAETTANVNRINTEGPDAGTAAETRATAEATYQSAVAQAQAASLQTIANNANATGQQKFDYLRATAEAAWISAVTPAFVLHAVRVTYAEEYARPYYLAQNPPPVEDDPSTWSIWVGTELTREADDAHWEAYYATTATLAELNRDLEHAKDAAQLGVNEATADKLYAVANATTDKAYAIAVAGGAGSLPINALDAGGNLAEQHAAGLAANDYGHTLDIEDSKLGFQQLETISRQGYSNLLATAQNTRDVKLATAARDAAIDEAGYQASADQTFALTEEHDWRGETTIDNTVAWAKAIADANLWTAEEAANVSGAQALDTALTTTVNGQPHHLPWTEYLVAEAQAHKQWWGDQSDSTSAAGKYVQWVKDENAAQQSYTDQLAADDKIKREGDETLGIVGIDAAKQAYAIGLASAAYARDFDEANARYDEIASLLGPTKAYLDDRAQFDHNRAIENAQHAADLAGNIATGMDGDDAEAQYEIDMATTAAWYASATASDNATYAALDSTAISTWYARLATDEHNATALWINAEVQHVQADAAADDWYAHAADSLLVGITDSRDSIANSYSEQADGSWLAALTAFATAHPSPWAAYALAQQTALRDEYLVPADAAKATLDHETTQADATEQDSEADDQQQSQDDSADDWSSEETTDNDTASASVAANAGVVGAEDAQHLPSLASIIPAPSGNLTGLGLPAAGFGVLASSLGTATPNALGAADSLISSLSSSPADPGLPESLVKSPEAAATDSDVTPAEGSESSAGMKTALAAINFVNSMSDRERDLIRKVDERWEQGVTISDAGGFLLGVKDGLVQGVQDGLPGMAVGAIKFAGTAASFLFQLDPTVRLYGWLITGRDVGADEQAAVFKFGQDSWEAIKKVPGIALEVAKLYKEVNDFITQQEFEFVKSLVDGQPNDYFQSKIARLSPLAQQALETARTLLVELAHAGLDHLDARQFGNIVGQVIYNVVEDAVVSLALGAVEAGTLGVATPAVAAAGGAEVAAKAAKLTRIVNRLSKLPGFNMPLVVKALNKLQDVIHWMKDYPICFVGGTPVHTADGLRNIEDIRPGDLVLARDESAPNAKPEYRRVVNTFTTKPTRLFHIRFIVAGSNAFETLSCTGEHPFYLLHRNGFVPAKELVQGDHLSLPDGRAATVAEVAIEDASPGYTFTTYNFEVADFHTYFVGKAGIWVHNKGNPCDRAVDVFVKSRQSGKTETQALEKAHTFLRRSSALDSDFLRHVEDADQLIRGYMEKAIKGLYPDLDDDTARFLAKKHWFETDVVPDNPADLANLAREGLSRVTPKELAGIDVHHLLPEELVDRFKDIDRTIDINDFKVAINVDEHRLLPHGIHTNGLEGFREEWNQNWNGFLKGGPNRAQIFQHLKEMIHDYGLDY